MKSILLAILGEINGIPLHNEIGPKKPIREGDCLIGEMSDEVKKLWVLHQRYDKDIHKLFVQGNDILMNCYGHAKLLPYSTWAIYLQRELPNDKDGVKGRCMKELIQEIESLNLRMGATMALLATQVKSDHPQTIGQPMIVFRRSWSVVALQDSDLGDYIIPDHRMPNPIEHIKVDAYSLPN